MHYMATETDVTANIFKVHDNSYMCNIVFVFYF